MGRQAHPRRPQVLLMVDDFEVRVITEDGELLRQLILDPTKTYQPTGRSKGPTRP